MIKSFKSKETEKIYNEKFSKKLPHEIQKRALQKLRMINAASVIEDYELRTAKHNITDILDKIQPLKVMR